MVNSMHKPLCWGMLQNWLDLRLPALDNSRM